MESVENIGEIVQVIGAVVDIKFFNKVPKINNAVKIEFDNKKIIAEVRQHLGNNIARCIAMQSTDGLKRKMSAVDTGEAIKVPVGEEVLGRMFNVIGEPIDNINDSEKNKFNKMQSIHQQSPDFSKQSNRTEIFPTGIKVIEDSMKQCLQKKARRTVRICKCQRL